MILSETALKEADQCLRSSPIESKCVLSLTIFAIHLERDLEIKKQSALFDTIQSKPY